MHPINAFFPSVYVCMCVCMSLYYMMTYIDSMSQNEYLSQLSLEFCNTSTLINLDFFDHIIYFIFSYDQAWPLMIHKIIATLGIKI